MRLSKLSCVTFAVIFLQFRQNSAGKVSENREVVMAEIKGVIENSKIIQNCETEILKIDGPMVRTVVSNRYITDINKLLRDYLKDGETENRMQRL